MRLEKVKAEIDEYSKNPQAVHSAGYGNSLAATEATVNRLNNTILEEFVAVSVKIIDLLFSYPVLDPTLFYFFLFEMIRLKPNTLYYYQCGDPSIPAMSTIYHFKTVPISSPKIFPNRIAIMEDVRLTYNTTFTIRHLLGNNSDLVLLMRDVTYANLYLTNGIGSDCYCCSFFDTPMHETHQPRWDYWGRYIQSLVSKISIMVMEGNHEIEEQAVNRTFAAYHSRFAFPSS
ncbi:Purple acid phosphatase 23 [Capsicum baccatum]|uniref:Purple acid phosphatase 23 n=1 Tax=Capsicum baccatum TaxID=33114 RepID=A0A2G2WZC5_CAPBA|nr:Purple acid phosphatase 23 [Capsicum baccatum]